MRCYMCSTIRYRDMSSGLLFLAQWSAVSIGVWESRRPWPSLVHHCTGSIVHCLDSTLSGSKHMTLAASQWSDHHQLVELPDRSMKLLLPDLMIYCLDRCMYFHCRAQWSTTWRSTQLLSSSSTQFSYESLMLASLDSVIHCLDQALDFCRLVRWYATSSELDASPPLSS